MTHFIVHMNLIQVMNVGAKNTFSLETNVQMIEDVPLSGSSLRNALYLKWFDIIAS